MIYAPNGRFAQPQDPIPLEPSTWHRLVTETNLKEQTLNCFVQREDEEEMIEVFEGAPFIRNRGGALGDEMKVGTEHFRRVGRWENPGADIYFDDLVIADEIPPQAVKPAGELAATWGKVRTQ